MPEAVTTSAPACHSCGSLDIRPSQQKQSGDAERAGLGEHPYRCRNCGARFYLTDDAAAQLGAQLGSFRTKRKRSLSQRLRDFWKHKRGPVVQAALFILMLALFLLCLRYLTHYQPENSPPN